MLQRKPRCPVETLPFSPVTPERPMSTGPVRVQGVGCTSGVLRIDADLVFMPRPPALHIFSQPPLGPGAGSLTAIATASRASNRVESSTGNGEFSEVMISGISVQPRITHSAP